MSTLQLSKRLAKLSSKLRREGERTFTLEEICRHYWNLDRRGFIRLATEVSIYGVFADAFQREEVACRRGDPSPSSRAKA
jgi:hypothetical protein